MFLRPRGRQSVAFSREVPLCAYVLLFLCLPSGQSTKASALMFLRSRRRQSVAFCREAVLCPYVLMFPALAAKASDARRYTDMQTELTP